MMTAMRIAQPSIHPCSSSSSSTNPSESGSALSSCGGLYRLKARETMAAISRMISVMSCKASHTNWRKVLGGLGGMMLEPNTSRLASKSDLSPRRPISSDVFRFERSPLMPPRSLSFWTPSGPRYSIRSRSCLSETPKREVAAMVRLLYDARPHKASSKESSYANLGHSHSITLILHGGHGCGLDVLPLHFLTLTLAGHASKLMA